MKKNAIKLIPLIVFFLLGVFLWRGLFLNPHEIPSVQIGKPLPEMLLQRLDKTDALLTKKELPKKLFLLNIWASWCEACVEEQVFLMELARRNIEIVGINYKDNRDSAKQWLKNWGNPYHAIGVDSDGHFAIDLGVYGAPETFLIDSYGVIILRHTGPLTQKAWGEQFVPHIQRLKGQVS